MRSRPRRRAPNCMPDMLAGTLFALSALVVSCGGWIAALEFTATYHDSDYFKIGAVVIALGCLGMALGCGVFVTARPAASRRSLVMAAVTLAFVATAMGAVARALLS